MIQRLSKRWRLALGAIIVVPLLVLALARQVRAWTEADFEHRAVVAYPLPTGRDDIIGQLLTYTVKKGDTLLDVGRYYDLSGKELSEANGRMDWWSPPVGTEIILPTEHILPASDHKGIILNIPEMRIYYYPVAVDLRRHGKKNLTQVMSKEDVVYTFPVGLGRYDWKTPIGPFFVRGKTKNPTWVVPDDIYQEHLERDGEAEHVVPGGDPDNPLGLYRLELSIAGYGIHGTDVPWGVGMNVSHGCIRLYPEDIDALFHRVPVGTPGHLVYQPIKYGWRNDQLFVEVHDDLYGVYPGLWNQALKEANRLGITDQIDMQKLEKAVESKSGIPTYIMPGPLPDSAG